MTVMDREHGLCKCGCGEKVKGRQGKKFVDRFHYQKWYRENKNKLNGHHCKFCDTALRGAHTDWCSGNCRSRWVNKEIQEKKKLQEKRKVDRRQKSAPRHKPKNRADKMPHLLNYCIQDKGQCQLYHFHDLLDENEHLYNCFGNLFTGSCYVPPMQESKASRTSCVNLLHTKF